MFDLNDNAVSLVDYVRDPIELDRWVSWDGVEGLIAMGVEEHFGSGAENFLRRAVEKQEFMKSEILRRYELEN